MSASTWLLPEFISEITDEQLMDIIDAIAK